MTSLRYALSVRQPWAWALIFGGKDVENRAWQDSGGNARAARKLVGQRIAIHASKAVDHDGLATVIELAGCSPKIVCGALLGTVRLVAICRDHDSPWAIPGALHLVVADTVPWRPIRATGQLGCWPVARGKWIDPR